jgi:hypothetical protein
MFRQFVILLFTLSAASAFSQPKLKLDSLLNTIKHTDKSQTKIDLYEQVCWFHIVTTPDVVIAEKYADSVRLLAEELKSEKGRFQAEYNYGVIAHMKGNYPESEKHLQKKRATRRNWRKGYTTLQWLTFIREITKKQWASIIVCWQLKNVQTIHKKLLQF